MKEIFRMLVLVIFSILVYAICLLWLGKLMLLRTEHVPGTTSARDVFAAAQKAATG